MPNKVKFYKNPERSKPTNFKPYVPQYQVMGVEPEEYRSPTSPGYQVDAFQRSPLSKAPPAKDNPRAPRPVLRQPYAETLPSPVGRGRGLLPNVGNNIEQTWSSVDGVIIDNLPENLDPVEPIIDNNEFVSAAALGLPEDEVEMSDVPEMQSQPPAVTITFEDSAPEESDTIESSSVNTEKNFLTEGELQNLLKEEYLSKVLQSLEEGEYLLLMNNSAICSGPLEEVQEQARLLIFGEHAICQGNPIPVDDVMIFKKAHIKIGLFLE